MPLLGISVTVYCSVARLSDRQLSSCGGGRTSTLRPGMCLLSPAFSRYGAQGSSRLGLRKTRVLHHRKRYWLPVCCCQLSQGMGHRGVAAWGSAKQSRYWATAK